MKHEGTFDFDVREKFWIHIVHWLESVETISRIQTYQTTADDGAFMDYAGDGRTLPTSTDDWDEQDNTFAGDYLCSKMQTYF